MAVLLVVGAAGPFSHERAQGDLTEGEVRKKTKGGTTTTRARKEQRKKQRNTGCFKTKRGQKEKYGRRNKNTRKKGPTKDAKKHRAFQNEGPTKQTMGGTRKHVREQEVSNLCRTLVGPLSGPCRTPVGPLSELTTPKRSSP